MEGVGGRGAQFHRDLGASLGCTAQPGDRARLPEQAESRRGRGDELGHAPPQARAPPPCAARRVARGSGRGPFLFLPGAVGAGRDTCLPPAGPAARAALVRAGSRWGPLARGLPGSRGPRRRPGAALGPRTSLPRATAHYLARRDPRGQGGPRPGRRAEGRRALALTGLLLGAVRRRARVRAGAVCRWRRAELGGLSWRGPREPHRAALPSRTSPREAASARRPTVGVDAGARGAARGARAAPPGSRCASAWPGRE
ncbi:uncharacterized protein LOC144368992 [Ictidomys tridecemlineatus]